MKRDAATSNSTETRLTGNDYLDGGPGRDSGNGGPGSDVCKAEKQWICEKR